MISKSKYDVYLGFAPHIARLTGKQVRTIIKRGFIKVRYSQGPGWICFGSKHDRLPAGNGTRHSWRLSIDDLSIVQKGYDPETGLQYINQ